MARGYGLDSVGRLDISIFYDGDPEWWLGKADEVFTRNRLSEREKVEVATACWCGEAWEWFLWIESCRPIRTWNELKCLLRDRFGKKEVMKPNIQRDTAAITKELDLMIKKMGGRKSDEIGAITLESEKMEAIPKSVASVTLPKSAMNRSLEEDILIKELKFTRTSEIFPKLDEVGACNGGSNHQDKPGKAELAGPKLFKPGLSAKEWKTTESSPTRTVTVGERNQRQETMQELKSEMCSPGIERSVEHLKQGMSIGSSKEVSLGGVMMGTWQKMEEKRIAFTSPEPAIYSETPLQSDGIGTNATNWSHHVEAGKMEMQSLDRFEIVSAPTNSEGVLEEDADKANSRWVLEGNFECGLQPWVGVEVKMWQQCLGQNMELAQMIEVQKESLKMAQPDFSPYEIKNNVYSPKVTSNTPSPNIHPSLYYFSSMTAYQAYQNTTNAQKHASIAKVGQSCLRLKILTDDSEENFNDDNGEEVGDKLGFIINLEFEIAQKTKKGRLHKKKGSRC